MTEKNIFSYKLFLSLNILDFNLFLCENCNSPHRCPSPPPEKSQASPFLKIWLQAQPSMYMYFFLLAQATEMAAKFAK